jgi:LytR cell envelope-related transcriptional attenuator
MKPTALVVVVLSALVVIVAAASERSRGGPKAAVALTVRAPDSARIRVQVLNGTTTRGLARRATMVLRDHGFDVVETGTVSDTRDTTLVLDLSGHPEWARRVARVLGVARIEARRDSSRYLDIAVVLGATWRPPAEPLHP